MDNKNIFAKNLKYYMTINGKSRKDVSTAIGVSYYTFTDWVNGKKYPRMDKVEKLASYFGISKSDLIEEKTEKRQETKKTPTLTAKDERDDSMETKLVELYRELNEEGQEKLIDYADDMVRSGKYIKTDEIIVDKEA